jgi:hypothetical protein
MKTVIISDKYILEGDAAAALEQQESSVIECLNALVAKLDELRVDYEAHLELDGFGSDILLVYLQLRGAYTYDDYFEQILPWIARQPLVCRERIAITPLCIDD